MEKLVTCEICGEEGIVVSPCLSCLLAKKSDLIAALQREVRAGRAAIEDPDIEKRLLAEGAEPMGVYLVHRAPYVSITNGLRRIGIWSR